MISSISAILNISLLFITNRFEKNKDMKMKKDKLLNEVKEGLRKKDVSTLNRVAYKLKRMRNS